MVMWSGVVFRHYHHIVTFAQLVAADYVAATVRQTSGGNLNSTHGVFWAALLFRA